MTGTPSSPPPGSFDKKQVIQALNEISTAVDQLSLAIVRLNSGLTFKGYSIMDINEVLGELGKLNKSLSKSLDYVAETKMELIRYLRELTRKQLNE